MDENECKLFDKMLDYFIEKDARAEIRNQERNKAVLEGVRQVAESTINEILPQLASRAYQKFIAPDMTFPPGGPAVNPVLSEETIKQITNVLFGKNEVEK